ncbi:hypothetical protein [Sphingopyxis sp.]|uniref:hypothetical protein n=1 Tax=Sphingopyxis sp. TaxID=1908224 RepID=UPI002E0CB977|nr:hypothetical protein [Sphingopyxis sp.]
MAYQAAGRTRGRRIYMNRILPAFAAFALLAAPAAFAAEQTAADRAPPSKPPSAMTPTEIKEYNVGLAETHPYYIKCRKTLEIGSLVKKIRTCYTNEKWKQVIANSSQNARETTEAFVSGAGSSSN